MMPRNGLQFLQGIVAKRNSCIFFLLCLPLLLSFASKPAGAAGSLAQGDAQQEVVIRGGWLFDGVGDGRVRNTGVVVRGGKFMEVGADLGARDLSGARVIDLDDGATILPGLFDLHAHHGMNLFGTGRVDEAVYNPRIFLANGVTSVFPAGEMDPDRMMAARKKIDAGKMPGPRMLNSGPYFGTARPAWDREATEQEIRSEVDYWAANGARGFKAKGITPEHLGVLIERAHQHGLPVTGHLGSGYRDTVNPRDAILMGIDRIEHFLGGDAFTADRSAYSSLVEFEPGTAEFQRIAALYIKHNVNFDATLSAYGYSGGRDPEVFTYWVDERQFFTSYFREQLESRSPRRTSQQFETIYWVKRKAVKAFYDAGGGHLITLGTDHPSTGEYLSGFAAHRELLSFVLAGIPPAAALKIATINGARAMRISDKLGTIEPGKLADLFVVDGNPVDDIRDARKVRMVMRSGEVYDPQELLRSAEGKIGPSGPDEVEAWGRASIDSARRR